VPRRPGRFCGPSRSIREKELGMESPANSFVSRQNEKGGCRKKCRIIGEEKAEKIGSQKGSCWSRQKGGEEEL